VRHLLVTKVSGRFHDVTGTAVIHERSEASILEVTVATASVDTGDATRDAFLRSADFFDADTHPRMTFRSTRVRHIRGPRWHVAGDLTIAGVAAPVTLRTDHVSPKEAIAEEAHFRAFAEVDRNHWDLKWNALLEAGGVVGRRVKLDIDAVLLTSNAS